MKKIAIFHIAHWDQLLGGAELQLSYMVEHYSKKGDDVHVIYIDMNGKPVFSRGETLHGIRNLSITGFFGNMGFLHIPSVILLLNIIKPEVIVTMTASSVAGACAQYAKRKNIMHVHFLASDDDIRALKPMFSARDCSGTLHRQPAFLPAPFCYCDGGLVPGGPSGCPSPNGISLNSLSGIA